MVRSSSVFLFVALSYRKERARKRKRKKIIYKFTNPWRKYRRASVPDRAFRPLKRALF